MFQPLYTHWYLQLDDKHKSCKISICPWRIYVTRNSNRTGWCSSWKRTVSDRHEVFSTRGLQRCRNWCIEWWSRWSKPNLKQWSLLQAHFAWFGLLESDMLFQLLCQRTCHWRRAIQSTLEHPANSIHHFGQFGIVYPFDETYDIGTSQKSWSRIKGLQKDLTTQKDNAVQ